MTPRVRFYAAEEAARQGVGVEDVLGRSQRRPVVRARCAVMRRLRRDGFTVGQIGLWLDRDHTTISHGLARTA